MQILIDGVAMAEDNHHHLVSVDRIDPPIGSDPQSPDILVAEELMNVKLPADASRLSL
jgi:hypothetical protein